MTVMTVVTVVKVVTVMIVLTVVTVLTVMKVVTVVTKQIFTPKNLNLPKTYLPTYLKPTYLCDSSYSRGKNGVYNIFANPELR